MLVRKQDVRVKCVQTIKNKQEMDNSHMEKYHKNDSLYLIWVDHTEKIVSFKCVDGFEQMLFSTYDERLAFAVEKCCSSYRIQ